MWQVSAVCTKFVSPENLLQYVWKKIIIIKNFFLQHWPQIWPSFYRWFHASCQGLHSEEEVENAADSSFDCTVCRAFKSTKGWFTVIPLSFCFFLIVSNLILHFWYGLSWLQRILLFLKGVFKGCFVFYSTAVVTKARETIEPEVMTQIVTKAKEMGKLTTWWNVTRRDISFHFFFLHRNNCCVDILLLIICLSTHKEVIS